MDIEITFINQSHDGNNASVVIFQKNVATTFEDIAVAWTVIENVGRNWSKKFRYPMNLQVASQDAWGNRSDLQPALNGQKWNVMQSPSGNVLSVDAMPAYSATEIQVMNCLPMGAIDAQIYKGQKLLAVKTGLAPLQKAVFEFRPTIWVGVVYGVEEGQIMGSDILSDINTEISLLGITKANLVMSGGGTGSSATPFKFTLVPTA